MTSTPAATSFSSAATGASSAAITQSGTVAAPCTSLAVSGRRSEESSTMRIGERISSPGRRTVSSGSSARTLPMPSMIASWLARRRCTHSPDSGHEMARRAPPAPPAKPSAVRATLKVTIGRPCVTRRTWPRWLRCAWSSSTPETTSTPAMRSKAWLRPAICGLGSDIADTTRRTPASKVRSTQGVPPRTVRCEQGSSVT